MTTLSLLALGKVSTSVLITLSCKSYADKFGLLYLYNDIIIYYRVVGGHHFLCSYKFEQIVDGFHNQHYTKNCNIKKLKSQ